MNIVSIVAAAIAGMTLGALWYSPLMFGRAWMDAIGKTQDELGSSTAPMIGSMAACVVTAVALAIVLSAAGVGSVTEGVTLGAVIAVGIVFTAFLSDSLFCGWGTRLLLIQTGYRVLYILVMSAIISAWPA